MTAGQQARERRAARNQLLFRAVNEQIMEMTERFRAELPDVDIVCECADPSCTGTIRLEVDEFTQIERQQNAFFVRPGHEDVRVEDVVDRNGRYFVVRKRDLPARIVEAAR